MSELRLLAAFARQLDQAMSMTKESEADLAIIATTSKSQEVDLSPLRRPGRLETEVNMGVPSNGQRADILRAVLERSHPLRGVPIPVAAISDATPGFTGADLVLVVSKLEEEVLEKGTSGIHPSAVERLVRLVPSSQRRTGGLGDVKAGERTEWASIGGLSQVKMQLQKAVEWPIKHPEVFARLGLRRSKGCLLYGPPGCGKTKLVRAAASGTGCAFLSASAAEIFSPYVGDSERAVAELFRRARAAAPAILFIDEIDALVSARDGKSNGVQEKVLSTLLNEMDGVGVRAGASKETKRVAAAAECNAGAAESDDVSGSEVKARSHHEGHGDVVVVCATSRPDALDPALTRPGRLDQIVYVPPPDLESRVEILRHLTTGTPLDESLRLEDIARKAESFSGADLESLYREAALNAILRDKERVGSEDMDVAFEKVGPSIDDATLARFKQVTIS